MTSELLALNFFLRLLLGHLLGDFLLQPFWLVLLKRRGWTGLLIHVTVVTMITGILLWGTIPGWWIWVILLWIGHAFIDQFRTFVFTDTSNGKGFLLLLVDQLVHLALIGLLAWLATGWRLPDLGLSFGSEVPNGLRLMIYLSGLTILLWVVPVIEVEFTMAMLAYRGAPSDKTVPIGMGDRLMGAFERSLTLTLILLGLGLISPLAFVPRLIWSLRGYQEEFKRVTIFSKLGASFTTAVGIAFLLLTVPFPTNLF